MFVCASSGCVVTDAVLHYCATAVMGKAGGPHTMLAWAEYNFSKPMSKTGTLMKWKSTNNASPNELLSFSLVRPRARLRCCTRWLLTQIP
jgi:hypothetical protein